MADVKSKPDIRIAIISDPHVGFLGHINPNYYGLGQKGDQSLWVEYALRWFLNKGIDALVVPGDIANACSYGAEGITSADCAEKEIITFGKIFDKVFSGKGVKLFAIYGNHDNRAQPREKLNGGNKNLWQEAFSEPYSHVFEKEICGFKFIGANWGYEGEAEELVKQAASATPDKPVFYVQHAPIKDTTCDSYNCTLQSIRKDGIRDFENVIALFGHTHCPITDERTIWQSDKEGDMKCTVISCGTFNYADTTGDLVRGENLMTKHALYLTVTDNNVNVERLSFYTDEMMALANGEKAEQDFEKCTLSAGADWNFDLFGEKLMDTERRAKPACAPEFPEGAVAGLSRSDDFVVIFFPAAIPLECDDDILHSYYAEAYDDETGKLVSSGQISAEFHVDHSNKYYTPYYQIVLSDLKPNTNYTFKVYARDCYQKLSTKPIIHKGKTLPEKRERLY